MRAHIEDMQALLDQNPNMNSQLRDEIKVNLLKSIALRYHSLTEESKSIIKSIYDDLGARGDIQHCIQALHVNSMNYFEKNFPNIAEREAAVVQHINNVQALLNNSDINKALKSHIRVNLLKLIDNSYGDLPNDEKLLIISIIQNLTAEEAIKFYKEVENIDKISNQFSVIQYMSSDTIKKLMQYTCDNIANMRFSSIAYISNDLTLFARAEDHDGEKSKKLKIILEILQSNITNPKTQITVQQYQDSMLRLSYLKKEMRDTVIFRR